MLEVLIRLGADRLRQLIGESCLGQIASIVRASGDDDIRADPRRLAQIALAVHGEHLLEDSNVRAQVVGLLPTDALVRLSQELTGQSFPKAADNALALSSLPWRPGAPMAFELGEQLDIPIEYLPSANRALPTYEAVEPYRPLSPLREYQQQVRVRLLEQLRRRVPRTIVQMPTGSGKTRTMMEALASLASQEHYAESGRSILWLAHVEELCEQAVESFRQVWGQRGDDSFGVVRMWGSHRPAVDECRGAFIVATYQKLASLQKSSGQDIRALRKYVALTVADEAHKVLAPTFKGAIEAVAGAEGLVVGLTATPGRGLELTQENRQLSDFFGRNLVAPELSENPIAELRRLGVLARIEHTDIRTNLTVSLSTAEQNAAKDNDLPQAVLGRLSDVAERNRLIVDTIVAEVGRGNSCLVFACTVQHSRILAAALTLLGCTASHLDSSVPRHSRRATVAQFREKKLMVLVNYGVLSTGFDAPNVSTVMITRPTTSVVLYSQMIGRGLRGPKSGGSLTCHLIDVRDNFESFGAVDQVYSVFSQYWS
jgi:DNA repair protein RadD